MLLEQWADVIRDKALELMRKHWSQHRPRGNLNVTVMSVLSEDNKIQYSVELGLGGELCSPLTTAPILERSEPVINSSSYSES